MNLLIVESPGKVKKIQGFLGGDFKVMASAGHVRDLPQKEIGVAAPDFKPKYTATDRGKEVLARLAAAVKSADKVYLATDPDREGEAIAWHLAETLKLKDPLRVTYTEITEAAVKKTLGSVVNRLKICYNGGRITLRKVVHAISPPSPRYF